MSKPRTKKQKNEKIIFGNRMYERHAGIIGNQMMPSAQSVPYQPQPISCNVPYQPNPFSSPFPPFIPSEVVRKQKI